MDADDDLGTELRALAERYALACDRRDAAGYASVFTPDGALEVAWPDGRRARHEGRAALAAIPPLLERFERTDHVVGASTYERTGPSTATGRVGCVAHHVLEGDDMVQTIEYADRYVLTADGWRIVEREVGVLSVDHRPAPD